MTTALLYGRQLTVNVAGKQFQSSLGSQSLRVAFVVERDNSRFPNSVEVALYNLAESTRSDLATEGAATVALTVGYEAASSILFSGALRKIDSVKDGADWITLLSGGDKEVEIATNHFAQSFDIGTPYLSILTQLVEALGVGVGNLPIVGAELAVRTTTKSTSLAGPASDVLADFMRSVGWGYSIQDGNFTAQRGSVPSDPTPALLTPLTGLLGVPRLDQNGLLSGRSLFNSDVKPGVLLSVASQSLTGAYVCTRTVHTGDTSGQDWFVDFVGKPI